MTVFQKGWLVYDMIDFQAAENWLVNHGRGIDLALARFQEGGDGAPLVAALSHYANTDGGFGNALEPDIRLAQSSVIATTVALQILAKCDVDAATPLLQGAMKYLADTYDARARTWPNVPPNVDAAAHAPWWRPQALSEYLLNPRAEIVGYMYRWPDFFAHELRDELTREVLGMVADAKMLEMHDLLTVDRLLQNLTQGDHADVVRHFYALAERAIAKSADEWQEYGLTPLTLIKHKTHPLADPLLEIVQHNIEFLAETQQSDGSWAPPWSWMGHYPDEWPIAERDIRSLVTADNLCTVKALLA